MLGIGIISPLMPLYAQSLGASGLWLGIVFSGYSLARLIFTPLIGKISDKHGRKKFICIGLFFYSLLSLGYIFTDTVYTLAGVRFLHGFASAMSMPIIMAYIGDISPKGKEGKFMSLFNMSFFMGMGLGPFLGGIINDSFGMVYVFYALCAFSAISLAVTWIFLPEESYKLIKKRGKNISFRKLLRNNTFKGLLFYRFVSSLSRGSVLAFLPIFAHLFGISPSQIGIIIGVHIISMSALQVYFGSLADKYSRINMIILGGSISAFGLCLIPFTNNFTGLLAVNVFMGLGGAISMPAATAISAVIGRKAGMGSVMSLFSAAMSAGMVVAPLISGVLMDIVGINFVFYFCGFVGFAGVAVFYKFAGKNKINVKISGGNGGDIQLE